MFTIEERNIYEFQIGEKVHRHDPVAAYRLLFSTPNFSLHDDLTAFGNQGAGASEAHERLVAATRRALSLPEFDGETGYLESEVLAILFDFLEYLSTIKKKD